MGLPLLALYALSVGVKSKKQKDAAKAQAQQSRKITNYVSGGKKGTRVLLPGATLEEGESSYGFTIGNSTTLNKISKQEKPFLDLFENPANPEGPLITRKDFEKLNSSTAGMDKTQQYTLGKIVGQRNPADNTFNLVAGYERFKKPVDVKKTFQQEGREVKGVFIPKKPEDTWDATHAREVTESATETSQGKHYELNANDLEQTYQENGYYDNNNRFVPIGKDTTDKKATHSRTITKKGNTIQSLGVPELLKTKKEEQELVGFYDENNEEVTFESGNAVKSFKFKGRDKNNKPNITEKPQDLVTNKNRDIVVSLDKDRKPTTDPDKEVYTQKFRFNKTNPKGIPIEKPNLIEKPDQKKAPTQDFRVTMRNPNGKLVKNLLASEIGLSKKDALSRHGTDLLITDTITTDENGIIKEESYSSDKQAQASNSAKDGNTYGVITLKSSEDSEKKFGTKNPVVISMDRRLEGIQNLSNFNKKLLDDQSLIQQINSDNAKYQSVASSIAIEASRFFKKDFSKTDGVTMFRNLPKNPTDALSKIKSLLGNQGIAKINNFDNIVLNAAGMLGEEAAKELLATAPVGEGESVLVVKGKAKKPDGTNAGTFMIGTNYPTEFKKIVTEILPQYIKSNDDDKITSTIASLIQTKKDANGGMLFTTNEEGKQVRVLADEQGLLTFIKDLNNKVIIGKKVNMKGVNRNATYLDAFFSIIHPYPRNSPVGNVKGDVRNYILSSFNALATNNFTEARKLIEGFTDANRSRVDQTIEQLHGGDTNNRIVLQEIKGKATSAFNAIITIDAMEGTYQVRGKDIDINTQQGELIVKLSGMKEAGMKVWRFFKGEKAMDIVASSVEDVNNALVNQGDVYDSINLNDPAEIEARKKNQAALAEVKEIMKGNLGKGTDIMQRAGVGEPSGFVKSMPKRWRDAYSQGKLGKEVIRKLAIRQYHKYMLAYQLAAAIQGGTGGRTISDQDVQNILSALNFGFFTEPELERATLQEAKKMMTSIYEYNTALATKDTQVQYSAIRARELLFEGNKYSYLGIGNNPSTKIAGFANGVEARRYFIEKRLLNTKNTKANTTNLKVDKEELKESQKLDEMLKLNKR